MNYTYIPEPLLYKRKSLDKLAMQHPLNATIIKRLLKMDGWNKNYNKEGFVCSCVNTAYYICTIMRLEFDPTFHETSYQSKARQGQIEGSNTFVECVTLSLVSLLIDHSTPEWHQKLKEVADDLRRYACGLIDERVERVEGILGLKGPKEIKRVHLLGVPEYLSKDMDASWILPDDFFQPRVIDNKAFLEQYRQDATFNWDKRILHYDEEDIQELIKNLGKTQLEKALLIHSIWKDVYYARKEYDGPVKETWNVLKSLAQEFCPDYMEETELDKIPGTGVEFEKRISELEEEVNNLKKGNTEHREIHQLSAERNDEKVDEKIKERWTMEREEILVELLTPIFNKDSEIAKSFADEVNGLDDIEIIKKVADYVKQGKASRTFVHRKLWSILHAFKIYNAGESNWNLTLKYRI